MTNNTTNTTTNTTANYNTLSRQLTLSTDTTELERTYQELVDTYENWATRSFISTQVLQSLRTNMAAVKHQLLVRGVRL